MSVIKSQCVTSKLMPIKDIRFSEFKVVFTYNSDVETKNYYFTTEDRDLKLEWSINVSSPYDDYNINYRGCSLNKITIINSNKSDNIFGEFQINTELPPISSSIRRRRSEHHRPTEPMGFYNGSLDFTYLPFECCVNPIPNTESPSDIFIGVGFSAEIRIKIYHKDVPESVTVIVYSNPNYSEYLESQKLSDVTLLVMDEKISAHKLTLAAHSRVFAQMFDSDMLENKNGRVEIKDIEPKVFKLFLQFIYSGKLDCDDSDELLKLIVLADKYEVDNLNKVCAARLQKNICIANAVNILIIADLVKEYDLKKLSIDFIIKNKNEVFETEDYKEMVKSRRADLLSDILNRMECVKVVQD